MACTHDISVFIDLNMKRNPNKLKLFSEEFKIDGIVMLEYRIEKYRGGKITLRSLDFYVSKLSSETRLISPQVIKTSVWDNQESKSN